MEQEKLRKCVRCGEWKEASNTKFKVSRNGGFVNYCRSCGAKFEAVERKIQMLEALGFECQCCGERNPLFLSLDHKKNNGYEQRKKYQSHQIYWLARKAGWPKDEWQVLCMNCNWARRFLGECPHKLGKTPEDVLEEMRKVLEWRNKRFPRFQEKQENPEYREKRPWKTKEMVGNKFARRKLSVAQVEEIKAMKGSIPQWKIGEMFGVTRSHIGRIFRGELWKDKN